MKLTTIILIILVPMLSFCSPQPQKPTGTKKSPITADPDKDNIVDDQDNDLNGKLPSTNINNNGNGSNNGANTNESFLDSNSIQSLWDGQANKDATGTLTIVGR